MRDEIKKVVRQFLVGELPRDEDYFQRRREEIKTLIRELEQHSERIVSWEPPMDLFNFYHLQLSVDTKLHSVPLFGKLNDQLLRLAGEGGSISFLHLLVSTYSRWVCTYWQRFPLIGRTFQEEISWKNNFQDQHEEQLFRQVQQVLKTHGWQWLPLAEGAEPVLKAEPIWPHNEGPVLVRHILFPGCGVFD